MRCSAGALCRADAEGVPALHVSIVADLVAPADAPADAPPADETGKPGKLCDEQQCLVAVRLRASAAQARAPW
jgi:hypothetical protein